MLRRPKVQIKPVLKKPAPAKISATVQSLDSSITGENVSQSQTLTCKEKNVDQENDVTKICTEITQISNKDCSLSINVIAESSSNNQQEKGDEEIFTKLKELTDQSIELKDDKSKHKLLTTRVHPAIEEPLKLPTDQILNKNIKENESPFKVNDVIDVGLLKHKTSIGKSIPKFTASKEKRKRKPRANQIVLLEGKIDRQKVTVFDLLSYNPPLTKQQREQKQKDNVDNSLNNSQSESITNKPADQVDLEEEEEEEIGPRVKVGANGELILDEQSCIIKRRKKETEPSGQTIIESNHQIMNSTSYSSFRRQENRASRNKWSEEETVQFYTALSLIGTDFTLMSQLFFKGSRSRTDLRNKYKREERERKDLIDKVLKSSDLTDLSTLEEIDQIVSSDNEDIEKDSANKVDSSLKTKKTKKSNRKVKSRKKLKYDSNDEDKNIEYENADDDDDNEVLDEDTNKEDCKAEIIEPSNKDEDVDEFIIDCEDEDFKPNSKFKLNEAKHFTRSQSRS